MSQRTPHPRMPGLTLWQALSIFSRQRSARRISVLLLFVGLLRLSIGSFSIVDAWVAGALVLLHPLSEWLIHVFILHLRPRRLGRWTLDTRAGHDHRLHHADPHDPKYWFIPLSSGLVGFVFIATLARWIAPSPGVAVTVMVAAAALGLLYEWTHYLCHTSYRAKTRWMKRRQRLHRLHHFKNEHYWYGVTMHAGDVLLGTMPDPRTVPTSPTCKTLLQRRRD